MKERDPFLKSLFCMVGAGGISLASRRAVALLGLGTASRLPLLIRQRSGVLIPTEAKQFASSASKNKILIRESMSILVFVGAGGILLAPSRSPGTTHRMLACSHPTRALRFPTTLP